ncbi:LysR family transcriptional regulator [Burkholderia sp. Ac-20353]|uniref:LysR family transcriptional regulator n=1 Tax=Burkholderia sp. Ac-20353 TaxID=2703894 RepID=UPI00197C0718|nr:LysR family transcriptional regulator [Burkholderia sp. Ac-20353]MBN3786859.1 LysR family transcriptional regulator [Burkholderia sp. Ac-20353]
MLDIQCLKDFLVLARLKHFGRAADECHVTTSGLSRRIQALEFWLGAPVFHRAANGVELTDAGQRLQAVTAEVVYALEGVRRTVRANAAGRREQVRFAAPHIMSVVFFPGWFPMLHMQFRRTRFSVASDHLASCFALLDQGEEDFVVFLLDHAQGVLDKLGRSLDSTDYRMLKVGEEALVPVCAPDDRGRPLHSLSGPRDREVSLLGYSDECSLAWVLESRLATLDGLPVLVRRHENSLADGLRGMALAGLGVAWLPATLVADDLQSARLVRAADEHFDIAMQVTFARRRAALNDSSEALWQFLEAGSRTRADARVAREARQVA